MELLILFGALVLCFALALVKSLHFKPNSLSEFELGRKIKAGDHAAVAEQERRELLPTYQALQNSKELFLTFLLLWLLFDTHDIWVGALLSLVFLFAAYLVAARGWLDGFAARIMAKWEPHLHRYARRMAKIIGWFAPRGGVNQGVSIASRDELRQLIAADTHILAPPDKARLLGAFDFGSLIVADAMLPADKIATVDIKETVGPVLLDRLHKAGHNMFPVVKKDIDHIKGWLYMSDLTPLDPELKEVKDAIRPTVHYVPANAPLQDVLAASLMTGRQLFIAVDDQGATKGLVNLADALAFLNGEALPKTAPVSTKSDMVQ